MYANFIHPTTGEQRKVKVGVSWTLFFFGLFFGIPFFIRKAYSLGILMCVIGVVHVIIASLYYETGLFRSLSIVELAICFVFLFQGNKMTAQYYVGKGFKIKKDDELVHQKVKTKWKFTDDVFLENNLKEEK